jgi:hypothetical protein
MTTLRAAFIAALLSSASAYADSGPHCKAAIGTGGAAQSTPSIAAAELNAGTGSSAVAAARAQS